MSYYDDSLKNAHLILAERNSMMDARILDALVMVLVELRLIREHGLETYESAKD